MVKVEVFSLSVPAWFIRTSTTYYLVCITYAHLKNAIMSFMVMDGPVPSCLQRQSTHTWLASFATWRFKINIMIQISFMWPWGRFEKSIYLGQFWSLDRQLDSKGRQTWCAIEVEVSPPIVDVLIHTTEMAAMPSNKALHYSTMIQQLSKLDMRQANSTLSADVAEIPLEEHGRRAPFRHFSK